MSMRLRIPIFALEVRRCALADAGSSPRGIGTLGKQSGVRPVAIKMFVLVFRNYGAEPFRWHALG
jgi:hypothetical protein